MSTGMFGGGEGGGGSAVMRLLLANRCLAEPDFSGLGLDMTTSCMIAVECSTIAKSQLDAR